VTNAYLHGEGVIILRLSPAGEAGLPLVEVYDESDRLPVVLPENHASTSGRGLATIADVTAAWGVHPADGGGKVVWASING
jgi:hypothetical protein